MTDVETLLRSRLHEQLDDLQPSTLTTQHALRAGHRARRRRTALVSATAVLALLAGGATAAVQLRRGGDNRESVIPAAGLTDRTAGYAKQFRDGNFATIRGDMTTSTRGALSEGALRSGWQETVAAYGPVIGIDDPVVENGHYVTVRVPVHFRHGSSDLRVTYDGHGRIIGVTLLTAGVKRLSAAPRALEVTARKVVADLVAGHFDTVRSNFDATMTRKLSTAELASAWQQVAVDQHGGFVSTGGVTATEVTGNTVIDIFCTMHNGELKVRISFDKLGRISGLFLLEA